MRRGAALIGLIIVIGGIGVLLFGCAPAVVTIRPPEPRVEVYGAPPYPDAVWIPGYWQHRRGAWGWVPGYWARPPRHGAVWIDGHWEPRGRGWTWIPGHWEYR